MRKAFKFLQGEAKKVTRKRLIEELQTSPLYPVAQVEDLDSADFSDKPVLKKFDHGAAMTLENPFAGKVISIRTSGHFPHVEKKPPKELRLTKFGSIRGMRTRPPPK